MNRRNFLKTTAAAGAGLGLSGPLVFSEKQITEPSAESLDLSPEMLEGIDRFLTRETHARRRNRDQRWQYDFSSTKAFMDSIGQQHSLLRERLGIVDKRMAPGMEALSDRELNPYHIETDGCSIRAVRWNVLEERYNPLSAEGLLLTPRKETKARIVMLPDADVLPETLAGIDAIDDPGAGAARLLAEAGFEVVIPALVNRDTVYSGNEIVGRSVNQPHREWIYRQGYEMGRHLIGYELQKLFAVIDWFDAKNRGNDQRLPIGVAGHGEGGLLALYAAALDERISASLVSGYFNERENVWSEPVYRNVFGLLNLFGDAELAVMSWPRRIVIEHAEIPEVKGPVIQDNSVDSRDTPGSLSTPDLKMVRAEFDRAAGLLSGADRHIHFHADEQSAYTEPFSFEAVRDFSTGLNVTLSETSAAGISVLPVTSWVDIEGRQKRTVRGIEQHVQRVMALSEKVREEQFWKPLAPDQTPEGLRADSNEQREIKEHHRQRFHDVMGRLPRPSVPANPVVKVLEENENWTSYAVTLDVWPEVMAGGVLLLPKGLDTEQPAQQYPVVVCQHGREGKPGDLISMDEETRVHHVYGGIASKLASQGYVAFCPQLPFRGGNGYRELQRKANPLGISLFSIMIGQNQRILEWLRAQNYVDPERIAYYGLSYGGKSAMRIPAVLEGYALSICSGDFNENVRKMASTDFDAFNSFMFTLEYEMFTWNLGNSFNYAEMAALIAPRPFMVERGHFDGVGTDEWVNYEFSKVRRHYVFIDKADSVDIEHFNGGHRINGEGTVGFLDRHLLGKQSTAISG